MTALYHFIQFPTTSGIYKITCTVTKLFYVGSAVNLRARWASHLNGLQRNEHGNSKLQRAFNKYGPESFIFEVIEFVLPPFLIIQEQYWLDTLQPFKTKGFNICPTAGSTMGREFSPEAKERIGNANRGKVFTPEARAKMSASSYRRGKPAHNRGEKHSPETLERLRIASLGNTHALGMKHTPETIANYSAVRKGKPAHNRGTKHTPEAIEKIRITSTGRIHSPETRAQMSASAIAANVNRRKTLIVTSPEGIEYTVTGIRQFCKLHNLDRSTLMRVAKGNATYHKGWQARFPD